MRFLRGELRSGRDADFCVSSAVGVGVFEKKPRRDFWPLAEPAFLRLVGPGVLDGARLLGGMVVAQRCSDTSEGVEGEMLKIGDKWMVCQKSREEMGIRADDATLAFDGRRDAFHPTFRDLDDGLGHPSQHHNDLGLLAEMRRVLPGVDCSVVTGLSTVSLQNGIIQQLVYTQTLSAPSPAEPGSRFEPHPLVSSSWVCRTPPESAAGRSIVQF